MTGALVALALAATLVLSSPIEASSSEVDGTSFDRAIVIDKTNTRDGIAAEYEHLRRAYPGWSRSRQALVQHERRRYDVLTIVSPRGEEKQVFFAIDAFFGR